MNRHGIPDQPLPRRRPLRALLVEDCESDAILITHELKHGGYELVHERVETAEAMAAALKKQAWDIVLSDHNMPHFNSLDAMATLKKHEPNVPFIIVSGAIGEETTVIAVKGGAADYVSKSKLAHLSSAVERALREADQRRALRESEEVFRKLSECSPAGVFLTDAKGSVTYTNPRWRTIFGLASRDDGIREWTQAVHPQDRARVVEQWNSCVREGREYEQEFCLRLADGSPRWVYTRASAMHDEHGKYAGHVGTITDITERKQAEEARAHLVQKLITAQEDECRRVSVELHDQMGQGLTALMLGLNALQAPKAGKGPDARQLQQLQELANDLMSRVHRLAWELRPAALDDLGLASALKRYVEECSQRSGLAVDFHVSGLADQRLQPSIETTFYRVVQEALTNVIKHAQANRVSVLLDYRRDSVLVIVEDNGKGFDVGKVMNSINSSGRLGLLGMQERAALVGAKFNIESTPDAGTTVFLSRTLEA
ncbi:MAG: PAS domain S-box protein [Verrucomicrobia bacterium]|nr:PAS domain S-box protein [Verrucomicrobiota bacterium]